MNYPNRKPKLTSHQLIEKMKKDKGIRFNITTERDAENYLLDINNYLRTAAYRKNYQKYQRGPDEGKYINLDFAYLKELSTLDYLFRNIASSMCIDIEHDLKVKVLREIEQNPKQDGYKVVKLFLKDNPNILNKIASTSSTSFTADLINKYFTLKTTINKITRKTENKIIKYNKCPIWVLFELITFGDLIKFIEFYQIQYTTTITIPKGVLNLVKSLRNASVHNNCIFTNFEHKSSNAPPELTNKVASFKTINKNTRKKKLSCRPVLEFVGLLYAFDILVSPNVRIKRIETLKNLFFSRMIRNRDFFKDNELIKSTYFFACNVISGFFP